MKLINFENIVDETTQLGHDNYHIDINDNTETLYQYIYDLHDILIKQKLTMDATLIANYVRNLYNVYNYKIAHTRSKLDELIILTRELLEYNNASYVNFQAINLDLYYFVNCLYKILIQHKRLLEYCANYEKLYQFRIETDRTNNATQYISLTDRVCQDYVPALIDAYVAIQSDYNDLIYTPKQVYQRQTILLLFNLSYPLIEPNTKLQTFVDNLVSVQNNKHFRNKRETLIAISETIKAVNTIRATWHLLIILYKMLFANTSLNFNIWQELIDLINLITLSEDIDLSDQLDKLDDYLTKLPQTIKEQESLATLTSELLSSLQALFSSLSLYTIERFLDTLKAIVHNLANKLREQLSKLPYLLPTESLQELLDKFEDLVKEFNKWLLKPFDEIAQYITKINAILNKINELFEELRALMCVLKLAICYVKALMNLYSSTIAPMITQLEKIANETQYYVENTKAQILGFVKDTNDYALSAFKEYTRKRIKAKCTTIKSKTSQLKNANFNLAFSQAVDEAIDETQCNTDWGSEKSNSLMSEIFDNFKENFKNQTGELCPLVRLQLDLQLPRLSLSANMPNLTRLNLDVRC